MSEATLIPNFAPRILEAFREANRLAAGAKDQASAAVAKALECGKLLVEQKQALGHGAWLPWLDTNVPEISEWTARRYMGLAKRAHVLDLNDTATIRQAYVATGIIPTTEKEPAAPNPHKPWVKFVRPLDAFRLWYNRRIELGGIDTWPEDARRILKNELRWFVNLYEKL
ncbi:hypothetical protein DB346_09800 [Verrucomicrobia bacterium LW23]|nr:hypothetical protein DB346_09800 [Verrucomicrobia bacterium LW23]